MNNFSFHHQETDKTSKAFHEYYCLSGAEEFMDKNLNPRVGDEDDIRILAKKIQRSDNSIRYSIKIDNNGKLFNPISMYDTQIRQSIVDKINSDKIKFKDVNPKAFDFYISFLRTKNIAYLHNAEREI